MKSGVFSALFLSLFFFSTGVNALAGIGQQGRPTTPNSSSSDVNGNKLLFAPEDLYFYEDAKKAPLTIAPKLIVRFKKYGMTDEKKDVFLSNFPIIRKKKLSDILSGDVMLVEFMSRTTPEEIIEIAKNINTSEEAESALVFRVGKREAIIDGVIVETRTGVAPKFIASEMKRLFGGVVVSQIESKDEFWNIFFEKLFFLDDAKLKLNILSLANVLHGNNDNPWVKSAYPRFRFLSKPITAFVVVEPVTGTIGQVRTITLTIRINDPENIVLEEDLVPTFGEGNFLPKNGNTFPASSFFQVMGKEKKGEIESPSGKEITFSWDFNIYVPEKEWVIPGIKIPYKENEEPKVLNVGNTTFFSLPHISSGVEFTDMPPPLVLPVMEYDETKEASLALNVPSYWFDPLTKVVGGYEELKSNNELVQKISFVSALILLSLLSLRILVRLAHRREEKPFFTVSEIDSRCVIAFDSSSPKDCYRELAGILEYILRTSFPDKLPKNVTLTSVKELRDSSKDTRLVLDDEVMERVRSVFERIDMRFGDEELSLDSEQKNALRSDFRILAKYILERRSALDVYAT